VEYDLWWVESAFEAMSETSKPSSLLDNWPWNPALQPWQRDIILSLEQHEHTLTLFGSTHRGGKTLMMDEFKKRREARLGEEGVKGVPANLVWIDEISLDDNAQS
jgi:hypothetical protein